MGHWHHEVCEVYVLVWLGKCACRRDGYMFQRNSYLQLFYLYKRKVLDFLDQVVFVQWVVRPVDVGRVSYDVLVGHSLQHVHEEVLLHLPQHWY